MNKQTKQQHYNLGNDIENRAKQAYGKKLINRGQYDSLIYKYANNNRVSIDKKQLIINNLTNIIKAGKKATLGDITEVAKYKAYNKRAAKQEYSLTYVINYSYEFSQRDSKYQKTVRIDGGKVEATPSTISKVAIQQFQEYRDNEFENYIYPEILIKINSATVSRVNLNTMQAVKIADVPMFRAIPIKYDMFKGVDLNQTNDNNCVLNFLIEHMKKHGNPEQKIIKDLINVSFNLNLEGIDAKEHIIKNGITSNQLLNYCKHKKVSLYGLDMTNKTFIKYISPVRNYSAIIYILANNHMYPVVDQKTRETIIKTNAKTESCSQWISQHHEQKINRFTTFTNIDNVEFDNVMNYKDCNIFYSEPVLKDYFLKFYEQKHTIYNTQSRKGNINTINIPQNNLQLIYNPDWKNVMEIIKQFNECKLKDKSNTIMQLEFKNQTMAQLGKQILKCFIQQFKTQTFNQKFFNNDSIEISTFNHITSDIFSKENMSRAFINTFKIPDGSKTVQAIDHKKCYTNALKSCGDLCLYNAFDTPKETSNENYLMDNKFTLPNGFYFIKTKNYFPFKGNGWYHKNLVEFGLNELKLDIEITHELLPSASLSTQIINKFINWSTSNLSEKNAKNLVNMLIGTLAISEFTSEKCFYTESLNDASYYYFKNSQANMLQYGELYEITTKQSTKVQEHNIPWYNQILHQSFINIYKMWQSVQSGSSLVGIKTDCIIIETDEIKPLTNPLYKNEKIPEISKLKPAFINNNVYTLNLPNWNQYKPSPNEIVDMNEGLFVCGMAGTGKSYTAKLIQKKLEECKKSFQAAAPTNVASRIVNGKTLHKFFKQFKNSITLIEYMNKLDYFIIDEYSMMSSFFYPILRMIKANTNVKFIIIGDHNQLPPVDDENIDFFNSPILKELCDFNILELTENKRSDDKLFNIHKELLSSGKFNKSLFQKATKLTADNLCWKNSTRKEINRKCMEVFNKKQQHIFIADNGDDDSQDVYLTVGTPIIAKHNDDKLEVFNNETYSITSIKGGKITAKNEFNEVVLTPAQFQALFLVAYCKTVHKAQGCTIDTDHTIHDVDEVLKSSFKKKINFLYVAISRTTNINKIYLN